MKRLLLNIVVTLLRLVYAPMRWTPLRRKVTIISRQSDDPSLDIQMLTDYLRLRYPEVECCVLTRFIQGGIRGKLAYIPHMLQQMKQMASSRVIVLDGYCIAACVLHHRPETKIIQMWHAIAAVKKFGYQTIDKPGGHSRVMAEVMCMHRNYDHILCPGGKTAEIFCEAFDASPEQMLGLGLPRLDLIWDSEETRQTLRSEYGIPPEKEILLYVPTFRREKPVYCKDLIHSIDPKRFALVICLHPLEAPPDLEREEIPEGLQVIDGRSHSTEEWIRASNRIITDYSALGVEAALTDKPVYYYIYDISEYEEAVGLNVDPRQEMPHATAITGIQLAGILARPYDYEELRRFREKYITIDTDACTARLGDFIYGIVEEIPQKILDAPSPAQGPGA